MEDTKVLKVHKGGHGGRHIGNSCHVLSYLTCIISV